MLHRQTKRVGCYRMQQAVGFDEGDDRELSRLCWDGASVVTVCHTVADFHQRLYELFGIERRICIVLGRHDGGRRNQ